MERTVLGNVIELLCELHGMARAERRELAEASIDLVGLQGFQNHYPKSLSGGMKMRASLARTLTYLNHQYSYLMNLSVLLMKSQENTSNEETQQLFLQEGFAGLFITQSITEAVFMSTKVLVMSARPGKIVASFDIPFDYPRKPDLRFDAEFARISGEVSKELREGTHD